MRAVASVRHALLILLAAAPCAAAIESFDENGVSPLSPAVFTTRF